jgi:hypothetical protein
MSTAQLRCCGVWTPYPVPGTSTQCAVCATVFTVPGTPAGILRLLLDTITAKTDSPGTDAAALRSQLTEIGQLAQRATALITAGNVTGT